jgi:DNA-binding CsgD family transcriptional regulator
VQDGRDGGAVAAGLNALIQLTIDAWRSGRWDEAEELAAEGLELCSGHGYGLPAWPFRLVQGLVAAARGDFASAESLADRMSRWAAPRGIGIVRVFAHHVRTVAALGRGDAEEAFCQASAISPPGTFPADVAHAVWVPMYLVEAAVRANRPEAAAAHVRAMEEVGLARISPRLALVVAGSAAMATPGSGGLDLFERALALPDVDRCPFDLARVHLAYGERLRRSRSTTRARVQLSSALGIFQRLGARPWEARARSELRATGRTKGDGERHGSSELTPQEREVALLAASGLTNRQIAERLLLSPRTVGAHLRQVFPKLGIRSRAALRDALARPPSARGRVTAPGASGSS